MTTTPSPFMISESGVTLYFDFFEEKKLRLRALLPTGYPLPEAFPNLMGSGELEVSLQCTGEDRNDHHGLKLTGGNPGMRLEFVAVHEEVTAQGKHTTIHYCDPQLLLAVTSHYLFYPDCPVVRRYVEVRNEGTKPVGIEYLSSAMLHNLGCLGSQAIDDKLRIHFARNTWLTEAQWQVQTPYEAGYAESGMSAVSCGSLGNWSTAAYLPMGMIENLEAGVTWCWQIEHNGSWHWEFGNTLGGDTYVYLGGPDEEHHQAWKSLQPGETYTTVPAALGCVRGGMDEAVAALTQYRRLACLRPHPDNRECPIIFNDYMNCLWADPTLEKELPLIDAAANAGCEYFVVDAGWYAEQGENWWPTVGLWQPSQSRFGDIGIAGLMQCIRDKGMVPGLWLEIESAGVDSPLAQKDDAWFFTRHGRRVIDHSRLQLDFRHPDVCAHANEVVDRLVREYGVGYIKIDYNMTFHMGTERDADSFGQGLLAHNRAYLGWLDAVRQRYPELVIENCGSGGCRMDYAQLSRQQLQSSSDQTDYRKYPTILVGALAGVLPEQLAVWAYPKSDGDAREASFNMVNGLLCRIHQSGHLANLPEESLLQVQQGLQVYRDEIRAFLPASTPFFPLGMPSFTDVFSPVAVGLRHATRDFLAVWRLGGHGKVTIPKPNEGAVRLLYPTDLGITVHTTETAITVAFPGPYMGAVLVVE